MDSTHSKDIDNSNLPHVGASASPSEDASRIGRWTEDEHERFLQGLNLYGREWKKVAEKVQTRTPAQIRSHAQKYFAKVSKDAPESPGDQLPAAAQPFYGWPGKPEAQGYVQGVNFLYPYAYGVPDAMQPAQKGGLYVSTQSYEAAILRNLQRRAEILKQKNELTDKAKLSAALYAVDQAILQDYSILFNYGALPSEKKIEYYNMILTSISGVPTEVRELFARTFSDKIREYFAACTAQKAERPIALQSQPEEAASKKRSPVPLSPSQKAKAVKGSDFNEDEFKIISTLSSLNRASPKDKLKPKEEPGDAKSPRDKDAKPEAKAEPKDAKSPVERKEKDVASTTTTETTAAARSPVPAPKEDLYSGLGSPAPYKRAAPTITSALYKEKKVKESIPITHKNPLQTLVQPSGATPSYLASPALGGIAALKQYPYPLSDVQVPAYVPYGVDKAQTVYPQYCATPRLAVSPLEVNPLQTVPSQGEAGLGAYVKPPVTYPLTTPDVLSHLPSSAVAQNVMLNYAQDPYVLYPNSRLGLYASGAPSALSSVPPTVAASASSSLSPTPSAAAAAPTIPIGASQSSFLPYSSLALDPRYPFVVGATVPQTAQTAAVAQLGTLSQPAKYY